MDRTTHSRRVAAAVALVVAFALVLGLGAVGGGGIKPLYGIGYDGGGPLGR